MKFHLRLSRRHRTVGIDIGSRAIKAVVLDHSDEIPRLIDCRRYETPQGAILDGGLADSGRLAPCLRRLSRELQIEGQVLSVAPVGRDTLFRRLALDAMADIGTTAPERIAERHIPYDVSQARVDLQPLGGRGAPSHALLVAAREEVVQSNVLLWNDVGLVPDILDLGELALCNALTHSDPSMSSGRCVVLDIGASRSTLTGLDEGEPVFSREISITAELLAQGAGATYVELVDVIRRSVTFFETLGGGASVGRLTLSGAAAAGDGLVQELADRLNVPVQVIRPFKHMHQSHVQLSAAGPDTAIAAGLALRRGHDFE